MHILWNFAITDHEVIKICHAQVRTSIWSVSCKIRPFKLECTPFDSETLLVSVPNGKSSKLDSNSFHALLAIIGK